MRTLLQPLLLAVCHAANSLTNLRSDPMSLEKLSKFAQITVDMRAHPYDVEVQAKGCRQLQGILDRDSADDGVVTLPAFQAAADAITSGREAALACIPFLGNLAVFNRPMTFMLNKTNAMKNTIDFLRNNVDDEGAGQISNNIASMSTMQEIVPYVVQLGGIDVLFLYLERWKENPHATLMAWAGLSDPSHGEAGARAIADHGGHNQGIETVMKKIATYPPHFGKSPDTLTVRYESLQIVNGMLSHDDTNEFGKAFLEAGLLQEIIKTMMVEPDMRAANSVCCELLNKLFHNGNGDMIMPTLKDKNVVELINTAFTTFHDDNPFAWNGKTVGYYYRIIPECSSVLVTMLEASPEIKQNMLALGIPQSLEKVRPDLKYGVERLQKALTD